MCYSPFFVVFCQILIVDYLTSYLLSTPDNLMKRKFNSGSLQLHKNQQKEHSNLTSFFRFVNKRASYPFGLISLAHALVNVTDFSIGSKNCNPNNADRGRSIIRVT